MTGIQYLQQGKALLRSIIAQRRWLLKTNKGYVESDFAKTECMNIENAISTIVSAEKMKQYLINKQSIIRLLIPATNKKGHDKLRMLTEYDLNLSVRQNQTVSFEKFKNY